MEQVAVFEYDVAVDGGEAGSHRMRPLGSINAIPGHAIITRTRTQWADAPLPYGVTVAETLESAGDLSPAASTDVMGGGVLIDQVLANTLTVQPGQSSALITSGLMTPNVVTTEPRVPTIELSDALTEGKVFQAIYFDLMPF